MNDPLDPAFADYWIRHLLRIEDTIFVLARPFGVPSYDLSLDKEPFDGGEPRLDLVLRRGPDHRILRFWSPVELEIEQGGPANTGGLVLYDLRRRGLDHIGVRVDDSESSRGAIRFLARAVDDITASLSP